jgi:hypothetical protein
MRVVLPLVDVGVPAPLPHPEPARRTTHLVVRVQDDPVRAVIAARQAHLVLRINRACRSDCSEGATGSGRSPGHRRGSLLA